MSRSSVQQPDCTPHSGGSAIATSAKNGSGGSNNPGPPTLQDLLGPRVWRFFVACLIGAAIATYFQLPIYVTLPTALVLMLLTNRLSR